jgi:small subunit ribosomal protein S4
LARYIGPVCRLCRREGEKLFLKGRSVLRNVSLKKDLPFQVSTDVRAAQKLQGFGLQLREKQKVKRIYGVLERQFRLTFRRGGTIERNHREALLILLERRLDNILYRLGLAASRRQARQFVEHGRSSGEW